MGTKCMKCGKKLEEQEQEYCQDCTRQKHSFCRGLSLYDYDCVADALYRFKYGNRSSYAEYFGEEIAFFFEDILREWKIDGIIPVPMFAMKQRKRGYNQAVCLAESVGKHMNLPVYTDMVKRIRNTTPLKNLNPEERRNNLKNAFKIVPFGVKLDNIVIVDDIYTTGSTVDEIADLFLQIGCQNVYVITLAIGSGV